MGTVLAARVRHLGAVKIVLAFLGRRVAVTGGNVTLVVCPAVSGAARGTATVSAAVPTRMAVVLSDLKIRRPGRFGSSVSSAGAATAVG